MLVSVLQSIERQGDEPGETETPVSGMPTNNRDSVT
jgi:hypothetical protein